jgi:hypothetical protein
MNDRLAHDGVAAAASGTADRSRRTGDAWLAN